VTATAAGGTRPTRRALTLAVTDLLRSMPDPGASASERTAWMLRKQELLLDIEEVSR
jgi:hypothetical protein